MQEYCDDYAAPTTPDQSASPDPIALYLKEIRTSSLLSKEEEIFYGQLAKEGDRKARQRLIESNLRLVVKVARRYLSSGMPLNDLIEEGNVGLIRAIDRFDPHLGFRFSTYGVWWIQESIENAIMNHRMVRLPIYLVKKLNSCIRMEKEASKIQEKEPHATAIVEPQHSTSYVEKSLSLHDRIVSLDIPVSEEQERPLSDILSDENGDPVSYHYLEHIQHKVGQWLTHLSEKQRMVVERRFGLNGCDELTLEQIGELLSLTRERVRQIQTEALKILRHLLEQQGDNLHTLLT